MFATGAVLASCSAPYQSHVQVDPMTGEVTRRADAVRLEPVQGHTTFGERLTTGSSASIAMHNVVVAETWLSFRVSHVSNYSEGLIGGGTARSCIDPTVRMNIDGTLYEFDASGSIQSRGSVHERTWGQATAGTEALSQTFIVQGSAAGAFMNADSVLIEYCDIVSSIDERSLWELQGRVPATLIPPEVTATELATACDAGDSGACYELGRAFVSGTRGVRANEQIGCAAFQAACDGGNPDGCEALSRCGTGQ